MEIEDFGTVTSVMFRERGSEYSDGYRVVDLWEENYFGWSVKKIKVIYPTDGPLTLVFLLANGDTKIVPHADVATITTRQDVHLMKLSRENS